MELKYSVKGVPYLALDDDNKLIFSQTTSNSKGYKWLIFSGTGTTTETISAGKGAKKTKRKITVTEPISTAINMNFTGLTKTTKNANTFLTKKYMDGLRRIFEPYIDGDIFPYSNIEKFEKDINTLNMVKPEDLMEDDPAGYYEDEDDE